MHIENFWQQSKICAIRVTPSILWILVGSGGTLQSYKKLICMNIIENTLRLNNIIGKIDILIITLVVLKKI